MSKTNERQGHGVPINQWRTGMYFLLSVSFGIRARKMREDMPPNLHPRITKMRENVFAPPPTYWGKEMRETVILPPLPPSSNKNEEKTVPPSRICVLKTEGNCVRPPRHSGKENEGKYAPSLHPRITKIRETASPHTLVKQKREKLWPPRAFA